MKLSQVKVAVDDFYDWIYNSAWSPVPNNPSSETTLAYVNRQTENAMGLAWWAFLRSVFWLKEPMEVATLRDFYKTQNQQGVDRDLTNPELFTLLEKFYFNEEALEASFYEKRIVGQLFFACARFRLDFQNTLGGLAKMDELGTLRRSGKLTFGEFDKYMDSVNQVAAAKVVRSEEKLEPVEVQSDTSLRQRPRSSTALMAQTVPVASASTRVKRRSFELDSTDAAPQASSVLAFSSALGSNVVPSHKRAKSEGHKSEQAVQESEENTKQFRM